MASDFTVRLLDDEATRKAEGKSVWLLERDGKQLGMIVHQHTPERRARLAGNAWYTVRVDHDDRPVYRHDFGFVLKLAAEMLAPSRLKRKAGK